MQWLDTPSDSIPCRGLHWLNENAPDLSRLPCHLEGDLPEGVVRQMHYPSGARLRFACDTGTLHLRTSGEAAGFDLYVDGNFWRTVNKPAGENVDVVCFENLARTSRDVTLYLPMRQRVQIQSLGIDGAAAFVSPKAYANEKPLVIYGSSIAQGVGSARAATGYGCVLGRLLNLDVVNLGFGGAGKAEPMVVDLVSQVDACCYLLDLGKSYGEQSPDAYAAMLEKLRADHTATPIICVTPIFASREWFLAGYDQLSQHTRDVVRKTATGEKVTLVEGETLLAAQESDLLTGDAVHPNDRGHAVIAQRLAPLVERVLR